MLAQLGESIRQLRQGKGLTLEELARRAEISIGSLSQLERGAGNPTFLTVARLAKALDVSGGYFFDLIDTSENMLVRKARRQKITNARGMVYDLLSPDTQHSFEVVQTTLEPGAIELSPDQANRGAFTHAGEEMVFVLRGRYHLYLDEECFDLDEGDTITFRGVLPHWGENASKDEPCEVLFVICPPAF